MKKQYQKASFTVKRLGSESIICASEPSLGRGEGDAPLEGEARAAIHDSELYI